MKFLITCATLGIALLHCSCSAVLTKTHISDRTEDLLQEKLRGTWQHEDGVFQIEFDEAGTGWGAAIEWEDDAFELSQARLQAKQFGESFLMTAEPVTTDPDDKPEGHFLVRFAVLDSGELQFFPADLKAFEKMVGDGRIPGGVKKGKYSTLILLDDIAGSVDKMGALEKAFPGTEETIHLRRLPAFEAP